MVFIVRQGCRSVCSSSGRPFLNFHSHVTIVRSCSGVVNNSSPFCLLTDGLEASGKPAFPCLGKCTGPFQGAMSTLPALRCIFLAVFPRNQAFS